MPAEVDDLIINLPAAGRFGLPARFIRERCGALFSDKVVIHL
jgi:hypothetical protein